MPSLWHVELQFSGEPVRSSEHLHGLLSELLERPLAGSHHANTKGWSCGPMEPVSAGHHRITVGLVDDRLGALLRTAAEEGTRVRLGRSEGSLIACTCVDQRSWGRLVDEAHPVDRIGLTFLTPMAIARGSEPGPLSVPAIFGGYRKTWRHFAPVEPRLEFEGLDITLDARALRSAVDEVRDHRFRGTTGTLWLDLEHCASNQRRALHALAGVAPFSGTGARTPYGMGVTVLATNPR